MTTTEAKTPRPALPLTYSVWLSGTLASLLGNTLLSFALGWSATGHGGSVAGLVLTAVNLPQVCLLLVGGVVSDRLGARRIMIIGDAAMLAVTLVLCVTAYLLGTPVWLLVLAGLFIGTVAAFYLPATGTMPRRLVDLDQLPRALALRQTGSQVVAMVGVPLSGVLVVAVGLAGTALVDAVTFAVMLAVLIMIREMRRVEAPPRRQNIAAEAFDGIRIVIKDAVLRPSLILTAVTAGFLIPVPSLLIPLLARSHHWAAASAGLVVGGQSLGILAIALVVSKVGQLHRPGLVSGGALVLAASGIVALTLAPSAALALGAAVLVGLGSGLFSTHIGPLLLGSAPATHLSRVQALVTLVQSVSLLVTNNLLGNIARVGGPVLALAVSAGMLGVAAIFGLCAGPLRRAAS